MLLFRPIKFSNQVDLGKELEIVKQDNIKRLKGLNELIIIQEDPYIFKLIDQKVKSVETFSTPQTESINLSDIFPYRSISNLEENTLIYNVGLLVLKPDLKDDQWKNVVDQYNRKNEVLVSDNLSKKTLSKSESIQKQTISKLSEFDAFLSHFTTADKLFIKKILKMNEDPYNRLFSVCGKGVRKCKWCGENYTFNKLYKSIISHVRSLLYSHVDNFNYDESDILKQVKYLRPYINEIKSGKYYFCEEDIFSIGGRGFCSKKCEFNFR
jgi:hypothetical protein